MDRTERFYRIERMLRTHRAVTMRQMIEALEVSRATLKRDLEYLRDRLHAPIVYDRALSGYRFDDTDAADASFELPGLWFSAGELSALITMDKLLERLQPGLLAPHIGPLRDRVRGLLGTSATDSATISRRVRIINHGQREMEPEGFGILSSALYTRRRVMIRHYHRAEDRVTQRVLSPQRLVHYRGNWYLDAWCHLRDGLRSFSVDAIDGAELLDEPCLEVDEATLDAAVSGGYGIFAGAAGQLARLRFTPARARWVASEHWHSAQRGRFDADGSYLLEVPFGDDRELLMDILRHGAEVEVESPPALRARVRDALRDAMANYEGERGE